MINAAGTDRSSPRGNSLRAITADSAKAMCPASPAELFFFSAVTVVAAAAEEKDKDDDPPAAVIVSEHEISPRKKKLYRLRFSVLPVCYMICKF